MFSIEEKQSCLRPSWEKQHFLLCVTQGHRAQSRGSTGNGSSRPACAHHSRLCWCAGLQHPSVTTDTPGWAFRENKQTNSCSKWGKGKSPLSSQGTCSGEWRWSGRECLGSLWFGPLDGGQRVTLSVLCWLFPSFPVQTLIPAFASENPAKNHEFLLNLSTTEGQHLCCASMKVSQDCGTWWLTAVQRRHPCFLCRLCALALY